MSDAEENKHDDVHSDHEEEEDLLDGSKDDHVRQLKELQRRIQSEPLGVVETDVFDMLYSFVKILKVMSDEARVVLLLLASSTLSDIVKEIKRGQFESSKQARNALKVMSFVLCQTLMQIRNVQVDEDKDILQKKDKASKGKQINWGKHCETGVKALEESLCDQSLALWNMNTPEEEFIGLYCTAVFQLLESPGLLKSKLLKSLIYKCVGECLIRAPRVLVTVNTSLLELVFAHEHLAVPVADLIQYLQTTHQSIKMAADLISEVSKIRLRDTSRDSSGTKNISIFLGHLATLMPSTVLGNLSIVLPLLDAESYYLRNAVVTAVTHILMADFHARDRTTDDEGAQVNEENQQSSQFRPLSRQRRDTLFGVLEDRVHDINSFARSHVLKCYKDLTEEGAVPLRHMHKLPKIAVERMQDKTSGVRKYSIELLCVLLEHNPYRETLDRSYYEEQKKQLLVTYTSKKKQIMEDVEEQLNRRLSGLNVNESQASTSEEEKEIELQKLERLLLFHTQALEFIDTLETEAIPLLIQLLGSAAITDVLETIRFFHQAHAFRLHQATQGIRAMLMLIWRSDPKIQELVLKTFQSILFYKPQTDLLVSPQQAAQTLLTLLDGCTVSDATCLEQLLGVMKSKELVPQRVVSALWDLCSDESSCNTIGHAIWLLSMLKIPPRLDTLLEYGLGARAREEHKWLCVRATSHMLQNWNFKDKTMIPDGIEPLVVSLQTFLTMIDETNVEWFDAAQQAIEALFHVCQFPEQPCGDIIATWSTALFPTDEEDHDEAVCSASELSKFVFILGHVAIRMAVYVESLASSVKDARNKLQIADKQQSSMEEELGLHAEIEAEEDEFLHALTQNDLVGRNLLGAYGPILIRLVANDDGTFDDELIKETATVALCKFMCISAEFCEKNLPLIFTRLKECEQPSVRSNIVVALGDLSFRFPNLVEPWTSHIYARLRDVNVNVRKNTIMVLTHLILNDMVKVKGQVSEIALSLVDEDKRICELAKLFFHELSKRGNNPIYNMLPDTIGRLSTSTTLSKKSFQEITKYLLGFIQKDKQTESLVEKLCHRFVTTAEVTHWRDLAYCLSNLTLNDKSLKKLVELRKMFKSCLVDDGVFECFQQLVAKAKKFSKAEAKETLDELENVINAIHSGENIDDNDNIIDLPHKKAEKIKTPRKAKKVKGVTEKPNNPIETDDDENVDAMPKRLQRKAKEKPKQVNEAVDSDDQDNAGEASVGENNEEDDEPIVERAKPGKRKKAELPREKPKQAKKKK
ncbi:hypothetical protein, variant 1 [Aphanomyces invadans]|uniref:Uncharacterized protein n=1 Tax=Aphanomyces invadans TaxID=157072 RepID=A0A024UT97_9STRA|nr:hypothetical protein, variant 1 [Aphanomyces invadans]ETW09741.1 hypothetical protein, variant 1 [Aphanomyces invadans]|eukprot:XP_008861153.1 hypothetical protein, variant 1 [Aphanomyces invadans]